MKIKSGYEPAWISLLASDSNGDLMDVELVTTTATDVVEGLGGVPVAEVVLNCHCVESVSLSALSICASVVLHILACVISVTHESNQEGSLLVAPALIFPVKSNCDGWLAMELLPRIGR